MFKQTLKYGTGLIALYLVVANGSNFGKVISSGASGAASMTHALQGR